MTENSLSLKDHLREVPDTLPPHVPVVDAVVDAAGVGDVAGFQHLVVGVEEVFVWVFVADGAEEDREGAGKALRVVEDT